MRKNTLPKLCLHKATGQAYVRLNGQQVYLGAYGTKEAKRAYAEALADWLGRDCQPDVTTDDLTILELCARYKAYVEKQNFAPNHLDAYKRAIKALSDAFGESPAASFGPNKLRTVRAQLVEAGLGARSCAYRVGCMVRMFKWAASRELVPAEVFHSLRTLESLREGRDVARRTPIKPVTREDVDKTIACLPATLAAMVRLQLLTGARPGEICGLKVGDIDTSTDVWSARLEHHKNTHRGKQRILYFGPRAQEVLRPFLLRKKGAHLFDPREAIRQRVSEAETPRRPNQKPNVRQTDRTVGDCYTTNTYGRAVARAAREAKVKPWYPNRLRHLSATEIRQQFGLDSVQAVLGHAKADTSELYAEIDAERARKVALERG